MILVFHHLKDGCENNNMNKKTVIIITILLLFVGLTTLLFVILKPSNNTETNTFDKNIVPTRSTIKQGTIIDEKTEMPPEEVLEAEANFYKVNIPDVFIANLTPFENESFLIRSELTDNGPNGEYIFFVEPKIESITQVQEDLIQWFLENGLTNDQISELDVTFE